MLNRLFFCATFLFFSSLCSESLNELGVRIGVDKSSLSHDYLKYYEIAFSDRKNEPLKFLEIGFLTGASAALWHEYFPNAELYFMEIYPDYFRKSRFKFSNRVHFIAGDQESDDDLNRLINETGPLDIILDDGGHTMNQQLTSFKKLFPILQPGGMYIIEDLHTSHFYKFGGTPVAGDTTTLGFILKLIHDLNLTHAEGRSEKPEIDPQYTKYEHLEEIDYILYRSSTCIIFKKY